MMLSVLGLLSITFTSCSGNTPGPDGDSHSATINESAAAAASTDEVSEDPPQVLRRDGVNLALLHWNVQGDGSDAEYVARDLVDMGQYHVVALSSVDQPQTFETIIKQKWPNKFDRFQSRSGRIPGASSRHLMIVYDYERLYLVSKTELEEVDGIKTAKDDYPFPLVAHLRDKTDDQEFFLILAHLLPDDDEFRLQQASALQTWAEKKAEPVVVMGSLNFQYNVDNAQGNQSFDELQKNGTYKWIKPLTWIDTEWLDTEGDGQNELEGILSDLVFVAGRARSWPATCRVIKRSRDFPDNERSSNHRPIELILKTR